MAPSGNEWLALTTEDTLEPEIPICDPHHHFWVQRPEPVDYQRYLLEDLVGDINSGHNVRSTVFIEARSSYRTGGPEELRPVGEVEFVQAIADAGATGQYGPGRPAHGIIGRADLKLGEAVRPVLEALQEASPNRFRGIRHSVGWDPSPELDNREVEGCLLREDYRAGARALADMGLVLENSLYFPQLDDLASFANAVPEVTIVLNHLGGFCRIGPYAPDRSEGRNSNPVSSGPVSDDAVMAEWRRGIAAAAACPNIVMKLGGIGMPRIGFDWHKRETPVGSEEIADSIAPIIHYLIEQFGSSRCMFESNFPVDKVSFSYHVLFNAFKRVSAGYSPSERADMFHDTAARVYRLD